MNRRRFRSGRLSVVGRFDGETLLRIDLPEMCRRISLQTFEGPPFRTRKFCHLVYRRPPFISAYGNDFEWSRGSTMTYSAMAAAVDRPRALRAVGQACGENPLPLIVPCHRVLAEARLGGFNADISWKERLLELESAG